VNVPKLKAAVRQRDGHRCTLCGMTNDEHLALHGKQLHVHRQVPNSPYTLDGSYTVCQACHGSLPKSSPGTDDIYRRGKSLMVYVQPALRHVLDEVVDESDPKTNATAVVETALRRYFASIGKWPRSGRGDG
jgi:hypothetical protein